jgi:hypothetical protein
MKHDLLIRKRWAETFLAILMCPAIWVLAPLPFQQSFGPRASTFSQNRWLYVRLFFGYDTSILSFIPLIAALTQYFLATVNRVRGNMLNKSLFADCGRKLYHNGRLGYWSDITVITAMNYRSAYQADHASIYPAVELVIPTLACLSLITNGSTMSLIARRSSCFGLVVFGWICIHCA